jgi:hypothetical protein
VERLFGFEEVRRAVPKVLREPETIDTILKRISVHKVMKVQKIRWLVGVAPIVAVGCNDQSYH